MSKRPAIRFSLLTLLFVMTLAALSISHWRLSREFAKAEQSLRIAQQETRIHKQTIRKLNDELGLLTIDDESKVHDIAQDAFGIAPLPRKIHAAWQSSFGWRAYLPGTSDWRICWTIGNIPRKGTPTSTVGQHMLDLAPQSDGTTTIAVVHLSPWESRTVLVIGSLRDGRPVVVDLGSLTEFGADDEVSSEMAGNLRPGSPGTESFVASAPIVLLRQWRVADVEQMATQRGIVVWLEPVAKKPVVAPAE